MDNQYQYDIFLSYRHRPFDSIITQKTFHMVESYRLPKALRSQGHDIRRAFRDTEELSVSRILTDTIDKALHSSNCLLLVCSTDTPSSEWVDREVAMFIELGRAKKIYPLLISGDPEVSFPPSLKRIPDIMDRVMDVRCPGNDIKKVMEKADTELLKILADATGCEYPQLKREHGLRKMRLFTEKALAAAAAFLLIGAVSLGLMTKAQNSRNEAQKAERASMSILQELTYGLPDKLSGVPGAYSRISGILEKNAEQINQILLLSTQKEQAEFEVAANYEKLATAMSVLGNDAQAAEIQLKAVKLYEDLCPDSDPAPLASALNNLGKVYTGSGQYDLAARTFERAISLQSPDSLPMAVMLGNAGANFVHSGDTAKAAQLLQQSIALLEKLDCSYDQLYALANTRDTLGTLQYRSGSYADARDNLVCAVQHWETICAQVDSQQNRTGLMRTVSSLAACCMDLGLYADAEGYYDQAIPIARELASDRENRDAVLSLAELCNNRGLSLNTQGNYTEADTWYRESQALYGEMMHLSGAVSDAVTYAGSSLNLGENAFKAGKHAESRAYFETGLETYRSVQDQLSNYDRAMFLTWNAYYTLIHTQDPDASLALALEAYELQPDNVLVNMNLAYACLYAGYYDDCDSLLTMIAGLGKGQADTIRNDLTAQQEAGLYSEHTAELLALLENDLSN